jgi:hypothetical protein
MMATDMESVMESHIIEGGNLGAHCTYGNGTILTFPDLPGSAEVQMCFSISALDLLNAWLLIGTMDSELG